MNSKEINFKLIKFISIEYNKFLLNKIKFLELITFEFESTTTYLTQ